MGVNGLMVSHCGGRNKHGAGLRAAITAAMPTQPFDARVGPNAAAGAANFIRQAHGGMLARRR